MSDAAPETKPTRGGHERRDVTFRPLLVAAVVLVAAVLAAVVGMEGLFDYLAGREAARSNPASPLASSRRPLPPEPRLQNAPIADLEKLRAREAALLNSYGWVDRAGGVVRVPIERAMELTLQRAPKTPPRLDGAER